jgi:hypothetical protein
MFWTLYLIFATVWTLYMTVRTYSPASYRGLRREEICGPYHANRPYFVGFFITNFVLAAFAVPLSAINGILRNDVRRLLGKPELV